MSGPKKLLFDIETAPTRAWVWAQYDTNVIRTDFDWYLLSYAYKWEHENKVHAVALPDFASYAKNKEDDKALAASLHKLLDQADIVVAHNATFDTKKSNARFAVHGFEPTQPYKTVCTLKMARQNFKFNSNKLDDLGNYLGVGRKLPHTGAHLWFGCMQGDEKAWRIMKRYNSQDVRLLDRVYQRLKPWDQKHPNHSLWSGVEGCPVCNSTKIQRRGMMVKVSAKRHRYQCQSCGHWFAGKVIK